MKATDIDTYIKSRIQLQRLFEEMSNLSKKNPDGPINKFKLKFINQILSDVNSYLDKKNKPFPEFEKFDEDELPSNSDIIVVLSQYIECVEKFRSENVYYDGMSYKTYWIIEGKKTKIEAERASVKVLN